MGEILSVEFHYTVSMSIIRVQIIWLGSTGWNFSYRKILYFVVSLT